MILRDFSSVVFQFGDPETAYGALTGGSRGTALAGTILIILFIGSLPFLIQGFESPEQLEIPLWIMAERLLISIAGGLAVYSLSLATGNRKPFWQAVTSCFMAMGAFMMMIACLSGLSYLFSLPPGFTWSPAELFLKLPLSRLSVFTVLFFSRLDAASLVSVYLWGRGLSTVWGMERKQGQRMVWAVYLFGILLLALPVFMAPPGAEGVS